MEGAGKSMPDRIEEAVRGLLSDPSPAVREAASAALDRLRAKRAAPELVRKLGAAPLEERVRLVFTAEEIGGSEGLSILLAALSDPEPEVRGPAARALSAYPAPAVLKAMVARLPAERGVVLGNLLESLGKSRRRELMPIVEKYLGHPEPEVRAKAVVAYARVTDAPGWEKILGRAEEKNDTVRAAVAAALGEWTAPP
ncbi:MAG: HEAT repeat domain-containing protein [Gemmatimonadota bacterium]